tara:strand:- start:1840 stop:2016 length:177 start_codon:yes stop_codon:yes gene_type:complete
MRRQIILIKIRWSAELKRDLWYSNLVGISFAVTDNKTLEYYKVPFQNKIIFKEDAIVN